MKSRKPRDYQRKRCYDWEAAIEKRRLVAVRAMSLAAIEDLGARIWRDLGWKNSPPEVKDGRSRRSAGADAFEVTFPRAMRRLPVALHEYAHSIEAHARRGDPGHGPVFVRLLIELLVRYAGGEFATLLGSARGAGLDVDPDPVFDSLVLSYAPRKAARKDPR